VVCRRVYHDGAMQLQAAGAPRFKLPSFEGPLDLLLHLIRVNEIDIHDIPIASIAEQYLAYLAEWEALDLAIAGDYLVMAATLLEIKSRLLLPAPPPEDVEDAVDPRSELVERLLEYQRYQGTVEAMRMWEELRRQVYFRGAVENPDDYLLPTAQGDIAATALIAALRRVLASAGVDEEAITAVVPRRRVSLRMKMAEVLRRVRAHPEGVGFADLLVLPLRRYDVVISFLALLELLRQGRLRAVQKHASDDITLFPVAEEEAA
jgi:segregation and condensation protein A